MTNNERSERSELSVTKCKKRGTHVYVRHAKRDDIGTGRFKLDPKIDITDIDRIKERFNLLVDRNIIPEIIYCSPFERTRETAEIAQNVLLERLGKKINIVVDVNMRDFINVDKFKSKLPRPPNCDAFKHKQQNDQSNVNIVGKIRETTRKYFNRDYLSLNESKDKYKMRISNFIERQWENADRNIWYITHGSFIKHIGDIIDKGNGQYPDTLHGYIVDFNIILNEQE